MNKPLTSWKKSLSALGFKVNWDAVFRAKKRKILKRQQKELANQHFHIENLEDRQMLSSVPFFDSDSGNLTVTGTENSDTLTVSVSGTGLVEVGGLETSIAAVDVSSIYVFALAGDDEVDLSGVDASFTSLSEVKIKGGSGADTLIGSEHGDIIYGGLGDDEIHGGQGSDQLYGDDGDAAIVLGDVNQDGVLNFLDVSQFTSALSSGGYVEEADTNQNGSLDFLDISPLIGLLSGSQSQDEILTGDDGDDTIYGDQGDDHIYVGEGDDTAFGDLGDDVLLGGSGSNNLQGGPGSDHVFGGSQAVGQLVVDSLVDELDQDHSFGDLSLREAVFLASSSGKATSISFATELFDDALQTQVIALSAALGAIALEGQVEIVGPGARTLEIDGQNQVTAVFSSQGAENALQDASISGLGIVGGLNQGIRFQGGDLVLDQVRVFDNGDGVYAKDANLYVSYSEISNNGNEGVRFETSSVEEVHVLDIHNSTLSTNTSGVSVTGGVPEIRLTNLTVADNLIGLDIGGAAAAEISNSIVARNNQFDVIGDFVSLDDSANLIGSDLTGAFTSSLIGLGQDDLRLGDLGFNGGSTQTYALLSGSVAIDSGIDLTAKAASDLPLELMVDQRGEARFTRSVDIGAFESTGSAVPAEFQLSLDGPAQVDVDEDFVIGFAANSAAVIQWTIDWGDGFQEELGSDAIAATHAFQSNGDKTITVQATRLNGTIETDSFTVSVNSNVTVPPVVTVNATGPLLAYENFELNLGGAVSVSAPVDAQQDLPDVMIAIVSVGGDVEFDSASGVTLQNAGGTILVGGTLSSVNSFLSGITYVPNVGFSGTGQVTFFAAFEGYYTVSSQASVQIEVLAVSDAVVSVSDVGIEEDSRFQLAGDLSLPSIGADHFLLEFDWDTSDGTSAIADQSFQIQSSGGDYRFSVDASLSPAFSTVVGDKEIAFRVTAIDARGNRSGIATPWISHEFEVTNALVPGDTSISSLDRTGAVFYDYSSTAADYSIPQLAYWPAAPSVYQPSVPALADSPSGLSVESLPNYQLAVALLRDLPVFTSSSESPHDVYSEGVSGIEDAYTAELQSINAQQSLKFDEARAVRDAAYASYSPASIEALQESNSAIAAAYYAEVERVTALANAQRISENAAAQAVWDAERNRLQADFNQKSADATAASNEVVVALDHTRSDAWVRYNADEISAEQYTAIADSVSDQISAERARLNVEISGFEEELDNGIVEADKVQDVAEADIHAVYAKAIADAGASQKEAVEASNRELANARTASYHGVEVNKNDATIAYGIRVNEIVKETGIEQANAVADKDSAIANLAADRDRSLAGQALEKAIFDANAKATATIAAFAGESAAAIGYATARANTDRQVSIDIANAVEKLSKGGIDADLALDLVAIESNKVVSHKLAAGEATNKGAIANALKQFRTNYLSEAKAVSESSNGIEETFNNGQAAAERQLTKDLAEVNNIRGVRTAEELVENRKQIALANNKRDRGLIDQDSYNATIGQLNSEADAIKKAIAVETFGTPGEASSGGATESNAKLSNETSLEEVEQTSASSKNQLVVAFSNTGTRLAEAKAEQEATAHRQYEQTQVDAALVSSSEIVSALTTWTAAYANLESDFTDDLGKADATNSIGEAAAKSGFYAQSAAAYVSSLADYAANDGDNPWSDLKLALAQAEADRLATVAPAYTTLITSTANATSDAIGEAADAEAAFLAGSYALDLSNQSDQFQNNATYEAGASDAKETKEYEDQASRSALDGGLAGAEQSLIDARDAAYGERGIAYVTASLVQYARNLLSPLNYSTHLQDRLDAEAETSVSTGNDEIDARSSFLDVQASLKREFIYDLALSRLNQTNALANAGQVLGLAANTETFESTTGISALNNGYSIASAGLNATLQTKTANAEYTYTVSTSEADRDYQIAAANAGAAFDIALANRTLSVVTDWADAQIDPVTGLRTPYANYSLDYYAAKAQLEIDSAPILSAYTAESASQAHTYRVATDAAQLQSALAQIDATKTLIISGSASTIQVDTQLASAEKAKADTNVQAEATFLTGSASSQKVFTYSQVDAYYDYEVGLKGALVSLQQSALDERAELHRDIITYAAYRAELGELKDAFSDAKWIAGENRNIAVADAAKVFGDGQLSDLYDRFSSKLTASKTEIQTSATSVASFQTDLLNQARAEADTIAAAQNASATAIGAAAVAFDSATRQKATEVLAALGDLDVVHVTALAEAEARYHIAIASNQRDALIAEFGNDPTDQQEFAIRVAEGRVAYLQTVASSYVTSQAGTTQHATDFADAIQSAENVLDDALATAQATYSVVVSGASTTALTELRRVNTDNAIAGADSHRAFVVDTSNADQTQQNSIAKAYQDASTAFIQAETDYKKFQAELRKRQINGEFGEDEYNYDYGDDGYSEYDLAAMVGSDAYRDAIADSTHDRIVGLANAEGTYKNQLGDAQLAFVQRYADAAYTAIVDSASASQTASLAIAGATQALSLATATAYQIYEKAIAQANRDFIVNDGQTVATAVLAQFEAATDVYRDIVDDFPSNSTREALAWVRGKEAYQKEVVPARLQSNTEIADGNLDYAESIADSLLGYRQGIANALHTDSVNEANQLHAATLVGATAWKTAALANESAEVTQSKAYAAATQAKAIADAGVNRDRTKLEWSYAQAQPGLSANNTTYLTAISDANDAFAAETLPARTAYRQSLGGIERDAKINKTNRRFSLATASLGLRTAVETTEAESEFTAQEIEIDAVHDFEEAEVRANLHALYVVDQATSSSSIHGQYSYAVSQLSDRLDAIEDSRDWDHQHNASNKTSELTRIADDDATALANETSNQTYSVSSANDTYNNTDFVGSQYLRGLPSINHPDAVTLGVSGSSVSVSSQKYQFVSGVESRQGISAFSVSLKNTSHYAHWAGSYDLSDGIAEVAFGTTALTYASTYISASLDAAASRAIETARHIPQVNLLLQYGDDFALGLTQGAVNIVNGLQDSVIGLGNLFIGIPNTVAYGINTAIGQEGNNYIPYIPSPDWSRGLVTQEYGSGWSDSHAWSKGIGAFGVELLSGNVFSRAAYVDDVGRGIGLLDDVAKQADEIGKLADDAITWVKCFSRDTLVSTAEGPRPIGEVEAGEQVHSYNFEKGEWELNRVVERIDNHYEGPVVSITTAGDSTIETTVYHPFWVVAGRDLAERSIPRELPAGEDEGLSLEGRWVNSHELRVGDIVFNRAGQKEQITQLSQRYEPKFEVSNLTIENNHNFAVGHAEILVHNTAICDTAIDFARKSGKTEDEIRAVFEKAGHSGNEIRDALAKVADPNWVKRSRVPIPEDVARLATQNLTDSGTTVLGSFDVPAGKINYIDKAKDLGASFFNVGEAWNDLRKRRLAWPANVRFLDTIALRGDDVLLSISKSDIDPSGYLARELKVLIEDHGYRWVNQWKLVKP